MTQSMRKLRDPSHQRTPRGRGFERASRKHVFLPGHRRRTRGPYEAVEEEGDGGKNAAKRDLLDGAGPTS